MFIVPEVGVFRFPRIWLTQVVEQFVAVVGINGDRIPRLAFVDYFVLMERERPPQRAALAAVGDVIGGQRQRYGFALVVAGHHILRLVIDIHFVAYGESAHSSGFARHGVRSAEIHRLGIGHGRRNAHLINGSFRRRFLRNGLILNFSLVARGKTQCKERHGNNVLFHDACIMGLPFHGLIVHLSGLLGLTAFLQETCFHPDHDHFRSRGLIHSFFLEFHCIYKTLLLPLGVQR